LVFHLSENVGECNTLGARDEEDQPERETRRKGDEKKKAKAKKREDENR
jgi:hypothetical protein